MNCTENGDIMIIFTAEIAASSRRFRIARVRFSFEDTLGVTTILKPSPPGKLMYDSNVSSLKMNDALVFQRNG